MAIITLFAVSLLIFVMSRAAGDPRHVYLDDYSTQADWDKLTENMGLDKPYYQQYGIFIKDALSGKFGESLSEGRPSMEIILERFPATLQLGLAAFAFSVVLGVPLGILSAVKRGGPLDMIGKFVALIGQSAPVFWLGLMLMFFLSVQLEWLPPYGRQEKTSIILPGITLGWFYVAANLRLLRSAMLNVLDSEYVKLARAKGVSEKVVIWKHALRNALIPVLTFAGITLGGLVTGSLVVETVFAWPGLGQLAVKALIGVDYPLLQAVVVVFTLMYVIAAMLVDIMYAYIDPRIRYA
jgi:peptide/nickel transport system permease protein|tara:strand:- start:508 stop:1395 length:888 start_codon:yes stop_codon:yes gene_type:complete